MAANLRVVGTDEVTQMRKKQFEDTNLRQDIQNSPIPHSDSSMSSENIVQYEHTNNRYGHSINSENNSFREGGYMENDKLLEQYISKMDRDQSDLRADIRASEQRHLTYSQELEKRMRESEQRCIEKSNEIEKRMDERMERLSLLVEKQNDLMAQKFDKLEDMIDAKIEKLNDKIETSSKDNQKFMWGITFTIIGLAIATIIGLVQIVLSVKSMSEPVTYYTNSPSVSSTINPNTQIPQE